MKKIAMAESLANSLMMVQDFASENYIDGVKDGFDIAIKALEKQIEMQTSGTGSSAIWADWLKYNKEKLLNNMGA